MVVSKFVELNNDKVLQKGFEDVVLACPKCLPEIVFFRWSNELKIRDCLHVVNDTRGIPRFQDRLH
jgi:hypothetical protein